jgi:integrase
LKYDLSRDPGSGKRVTKYVTIKASGKREAERRLAELISGIEKGTYIEPNRITVAKFVRDRVDAWEATGVISARTAQRYRQLAEHQIVPYLGHQLLQKLRPADIEAWHAVLRTSKRKRGNGTISPRTISHAHKILGKALADATRNELIHRNVARQIRPNVQTSTEVETEMVIVRDVPALLMQLEGSRLRLHALLGLLETLALRLNRIKDSILEIREAVEETGKHGIRIKSPKSKAGKRDISLPDLVIEALREHRRSMLELRLKLGLGKLPDNALLFADVDGDLPSPSAVSKAFGDLMGRLGHPQVTYHGLRHTHASQLIDAGVDIVTISKRLGHADPSITLRVYAHLFKKDDSKAAAAINAALS